MTTPGYPKIQYRTLSARRYEVKVQASPRAKAQPIGEIQQFGSLPSMRHWRARGNWAGAESTRSRQSRSDSAADLWSEWTHR